MGTVNDIYDAVAGVVTENGLEGATVKRIAQKVDKSEALLYRYCDSKDDLLRKTYEYAASLIFDRFAASTAEELDAIDDVVERIAILWKKYLKRLILLGDIGYFYCLYSETYGLRSLEFKLLHRDVKTDNQYYNDMVAKMESECEERGIPWPSISLMFSNLTFLNIIRIRKANYRMTDKDMNQTVEFIMNGLNGDFRQYEDQ